MDHTYRRWGSEVLRVHVLKQFREVTNSNLSKSTIFGLAPLDQHFCYFRVGAMCDSSLHGLFSLHNYKVLLVDCFNQDYWCYCLQELLQRLICS